jgi:signal transduction histidine kinase
MPVFDADGRVTFIDGVIFDVTDRKMSELELQETNAKLHDAMDKLARQERFTMMGQITATVSHELRNPLGAIRTSLFTIAQTADKQNPLVRRAVERAERGVQRCDAIVADLLDFVRHKELNRVSARSTAGWATCWTSMSCRPASPSSATSAPASTSPSTRSARAGSSSICSTMRRRP